MTAEVTGVCQLQLSSAGMKSEEVDTLIYTACHDRCYHVLKLIAFHLSLFKQPSTIISRWWVWKWEWSKSKHCNLWLAFVSLTDPYQLPDQYSTCATLSMRWGKGRDIYYQLPSSAPGKKKKKKEEKKKVSNSDCYWWRIIKTRLMFSGCILVRYMIWCLLPFPVVLGHSWWWTWHISKKKKKKKKKTQKGKLISSLLLLHLPMLGKPTFT